MKAQVAVAIALRVSFCKRASRQVEVPSTKPVPLAGPLAPRTKQVGRSSRTLGDDHLFVRELASTEDQISAARRIYNGNVQAYNTKIQVFPNNMLAGQFGFTPREFFEIEDPADREPVRVSFS